MIATASTVGVVMVLTLVYRWMTSNHPAEKVQSSCATSFLLFLSCFGQVQQQGSTANDDRNTTHNILSSAVSAEAKIDRVRQICTFHILSYSRT
jgi:hypothetical protein